MELSGDAAASVRQAFAPAGEVESQISVLGGVLLIVASLSFTRALQRLYQFAWDQPPLGLRSAEWGLIWLGLAIAILTVRPVVLQGVHGMTKVIITIAFGTLLWLVTPYILLARRVPWRRLVPTALLTAVGMTVLSAGSAVWMPRSVSASAEQFGTIGVAFALLSWLVGAGLVLVFSAAGGAVIEDRLRGRDARKRSRQKLMTG